MSWTSGGLYGAAFCYKIDTQCNTIHNMLTTGSAFIKPDQPDPWIKDQLGKALLSTILHLLLQNFVSCGRDKPSHMIQNFVTVGEKLLTIE